MTKKRKESAGNSVNTVLEKAQENPKASILQVSEELLDGLKNETQLSLEEQRAREKLKLQIQREYYKNKALFYVGVVGAALGMFFIFRYFKSPPPKNIPSEVLNGIVSIVPKK